MSITSYAQNFEDVMLWRALGHIERGCYVDIGAQDPIIDSVSHAFHEHQWLGLHVEPTPHYADMLRHQRPGDTVIQAAVGNGPAVLRFFEIPNTGISTADASIAAQHRERGFNVHEVTVVCVTLSAVFEAFAQTEIHWLKIDVEGFEEQVLSSWEASTVRPWIVVIESTLPLTQIETHEKWEPILIGYGYSPAYFDGLNRYYISKEHPELKAAFATPPNVFDGFALNGTASASFHKVIEARYQQKMGENLAQSEQLQQSLQHEAERLYANLFSSTETYAAQGQALNQKLQTLQEQHVQLQQELVTREQVLLERAERAKQQLENILRTQIQREQAMAEKLDAVYSQAAQESVEMARCLKEQQHALHSQHTVREQALGQELEAEKRERRQREQTLLEQTSLAKQEVEDQLRTQAQREREVLAQMLAVQQQSTREKAELTRRHAEKVHELGSQKAQRQKAVTQQLHAHQQELRNLHKERVKRQQEATQEKANLARRHSEQEHALLRQQVECEKTHSLQLLTQQDEFHNLHVAHSKREQALLEEHKQIRQQRNGLRDAQVQREQAAFAQLEAAQKKAAQDIAELLQKQSEQEQARHRQHTEREATLTQQLQKLQHLLQRQQEDGAQIEGALNNQIVALQNETKVLHDAQQLQALQLDHELNAIFDAKERLTKVHAETETQLRREIQIEKEISLRLRQSLAEVQRILEITYSSIFWRITLPLRKFVILIAAKEKPRSKHTIGGKVNLGYPPSTLISESKPINNEPKPTEATMTRSVQANTLPLSAPATTLNELMAYQDQDFINCAYLTILKRSPDSAGMKYYLNRLRIGVPKIQILDQLLNSKEVISKVNVLPGLLEAIKRQNLTKLPLIGKIFRQFIMAEGESIFECRLRAMEQQLFLLSQRTDSHIDRLDKNIATLQRITTLQMQSLVDLISAAAEGKCTKLAPLTTKVSQNETCEVDAHSSRTMDIYQQLRSAIDMKIIKEGM